MEFGHALGHHREVGHHVVSPEESEHGLKEVAELFGSGGDDVLEGDFGLDAPVPSVVEGGNLGGGVLAGALAEEDVVGGVGVEGRVEVYEVNALVGDVLSQYVEVVSRSRACCASLMLSMWVSSGSGLWR